MIWHCELQKGWSCPCNRKDQCKYLEKSQEFGFEHYQITHIVRYQSGEVKQAVGYMSLGFPRSLGWRSYLKAIQVRLKVKNEMRILKRESTVSDAFLMGTAGQIQECEVITGFKSWSALEVVGCRGEDSLTEGLRENNNRDTTSTDDSTDEVFSSGSREMKGVKGQRRGLGFFCSF